MPDPHGEGADAGAVEKVATGIRGLDEMLHGGIPAGRLTLVTGGPGSGKTVLGVEFLYRAALKGAPGVFVAFEETAEAVRANARSMGFDLAALERAQKLVVASPELPQSLTTAGDFDIQGLLAGLTARIDAIQARCIVIDALDVIVRLFENGRREREEIERLHRWQRARGLTAVLTLKVPKSDDRLYPYLDFMADCVLRLDQRIADQIRTRRLAVIKYRGSGFMSNEAPFALTPTGIRILPVAGIVKPCWPTAKDRIGSGSRQLDQILGGGFRPGERILLAGAAGTGKTTLAAAFTDTACRAGQRVLFVNYETSAQALVDSMRSPGIDLGPHLAAGTLSVVDAIPEAASVEEHLVRVLDAAAAFQPGHMVIDAVSALQRMGSDRAGFEMLVRLFSYCGKHRITLLLLNQAPACPPFPNLSGFGVSSLVDTIIYLQFVENAGRMRTRLLVVKSRGSAHARDYQELRIGNHGIEIVPDRPLPAPVAHRGTEAPR
jgi:circadian clock protein KaiC